MQLLWQGLTLNLVLCAFHLASGTGCTPPLPDTELPPDASLPGPACASMPFPGDLLFERQQGAPPPHPPCPDGLPEGRMKIEAVRTAPYDTSGGFNTYLDITSLFFAQPCGATLRIGLQNKVVDFQPGSIISTDVRQVIRDPDRDVSLDWLYRDDRGGFLIGAALQTRPEVFDSVLWDGLNLSVEQPPICWRTAAYGNLRVHFRVDGHDCAVDGYGSQCCPLWGGELYEVRVASAAELPGDTPPRRLLFLISKKGLVKSAGVEPPSPAVCP